MLKFKLPISCTVFWLGYIVLLTLLPVIFPADVTLPNVAARSGYNIGLVYPLLAFWSICGLLFFALVSTKGWSFKTLLTNSSTNRTPQAIRSEDLIICESLTQDFSSSSRRRNRRIAGYTTVSTTQKTDKKTSQKTHIIKSSLLSKPVLGWLECLLVGTVASLLYWPQFLARYGNYIEATYFMNVLARMQCGQLPYQDFEFLYGPLMIYPAHYWINLFGFSMQSYYTLIAFLQAAFFILLLRLFQHHVPIFKTRLLAFALFAPFVFDTLLGLNYIGWRTMPAILAMLAVSARPNAIRQESCCRWPGGYATELFL